MKFKNFSLKNVKRKLGEFDYRKGSLIAAIILVFAALYYYRSLFIAAVVNNQPIFRLNIVRVLESRAGKEALDAAIDRSLILQAAKQNNIKVSQDDIDADKSKIEENLKAQGYTLAEVLAQQNIKEDDLNEQIKTQLIVQQLVADTIAVSDEEIDNYAQNSGYLAEGEELTRENRDLIKSQLESQKLGGEYQNLLAKLRKDAEIKRFVDY